MRGEDVGKRGNSDARCLVGSTIGQIRRGGRAAQEYCSDTTLRGVVRHVECFRRV